MRPVLRAKLKVDEIKSLTNHDIISMSASPKEDTDVPCDAGVIASASFVVELRDHALCEKFKVGEEYYADFTPVIGTRT